MKRSCALWVSIFVGLAAFLSCAPAWAQLEYGPFTITGFYELIANTNDGHINPNNVGWPQNRSQIGFPLVPGIPPQLGLRHTSGRPYFNYFGQDIDLRLQGNFSDEFSIFIEPRLWFDLTKSADPDYIQYESVPAHYGGDGWLARVGGKDFKAELWQGFLDYRKGGLWVRVGKQSVAWGEDLAFRILDQICPLDLSEYFFFGRGFEAFDRQRIPEWLLRANYTIQTEPIPDLTFEGIVSPGTWTPNILPQQGAPYNVVPSALAYQERVHMGRPIVAGRITGTDRNVQFSINALTRPQDASVGVATGKIIPDRNGGLPLIFFLGNPTLFRIQVFGEHPRFWLFGGSANYSWDWAGAILRAETAVIPDQAFTYPNAVKIVQRPQWLMFASIDRPTYLIPGQDSMLINLQFLETYTAGHTLHVQTNGFQIDPAVQDVLLFFSSRCSAKEFTWSYYRSGIPTTVTGYSRESTGRSETITG